MNNKRVFDGIKFEYKIDGVTDPEHTKVEKNGQLSIAALLFIIMDLATAYNK